ncbi:MAG: hypothetical protein M0R30_00765 [Methanoregula sp.]|jgi:hypothetical protein|uniref:hypothetical protein n=1 Tax=Methanoregula sp. TaxID=2052170 RepID=UPI0025E342EB|nr:hypothetical protein [Methanoregula sp.]MCK9630149.1 hypothetical protein [Methanoregula sp.]
MNDEIIEYEGTNGGILRKNNGSKAFEIKGKIEIKEKIAISDLNAIVAPYHAPDVKFEQDLNQLTDDHISRYLLETQVIRKSDGVEGIATISDILLIFPNRGLGEKVEFIPIKKPN